MRTLLELGIDVNRITVHVYVTHVTHLPIDESGKNRIKQILEIVGILDKKKLIVREYYLNGRF